MNGIISYFGLPKQIEVLLIILIGSIILALDDSLFYIKSNLQQVWDMGISVDVFPVDHQLMLRYLICAIIMIRTFTVHVFLALYIVMIWPAIFADRASLMLPWLVLGLFRSVIVNLLALFTGCYICFHCKGTCLICFDFILSQIISHGPSIYSWLIIKSYYQDLKRIAPEQEKAKQRDLEEIARRRRKARYMALAHVDFDNKTDDGRNLISESTIEGLMHLLNKNLNLNQSRSLDSLLALRAAEEHKKEIMDIESTSSNHLKTLKERIMVHLQVTQFDIDLAKKEQNERHLMMISEFALQKINSANGLISTVSSESFFVKNGKCYKRKSSVSMINHFQCDQSLQKSDLPVVAEDEVEVGNVILEAKSRKTAEKCQCCNTFA